MGQFKPMIKMETTEPSVILKLKKGGPVKKADGGMMMAPRGRAMPAAPLGRGMRRGAGRPAVMPPMPAMKEGGKADMAQDKAMIKKAMKQHDMQEHKGGKGTELTLRKGGALKKATGGVVNGQGGFKTGGSAKKAYATGGAVNTGRAVAMPKKAPSAPVAIDRLAGTFKRGGTVC